MSEQIADQCNERISIALKMPMYLSKHKNQRLRKRTDQEKSMKEEVRSKFTCERGERRSFFDGFASSSCCFLGSRAAAGKEEE